MNEAKLHVVVAKAKQRALEEKHPEIQAFRMALEEVFSLPVRKALELTYRYTSNDKPVASFEVDGKEAVIFRPPESPFERQTLKNWQVNVSGSDASLMGITFAFDTEQEFLMKFSDLREKIRKLP